MFRAGARPKAPGARREPQGAEKLPKTWGRIYHFILPKVCPENTQKLKSHKLSGRVHARAGRRILRPGSFFGGFSLGKGRRRHSDHQN